MAAAGVLIRAMWSSRGDHPRHCARIAFELPVATRCRASVGGWNSAGTSRLVRRGRRASAADLAFAPDRRTFSWRQIGSSSRSIIAHCVPPCREDADGCRVHGSRGDALRGHPLPMDVRDDVVHVATPHGAPRAGAGRSRQSFPPRPHDIVERAGMRVLAPARTWVSLGRVLGLADLVAAGDHLVTRPSAAPATRCALRPSCSSVVVDDSRAPGWYGSRGRCLRRRAAVAARVFACVLCVTGAGCRSPNATSASRPCSCSISPGRVPALHSTITVPSTARRRSTRRMWVGSSSPRNRVGPHPGHRV